MRARLGAWTRAGETDQLVGDSGVATHRFCNVVVLCFKLCQKRLRAAIGGVTRGGRPLGEK
jgi:hypothetical protein